MIAATRPELVDAYAVGIVCVVFALVVGILCGVGLSEGLGLVRTKRYSRAALLTAVITFLLITFVIIAGILIYNAAWTDYRRSPE